MSILNQLSANSTLFGNHNLVNLQLLHNQHREIVHGRKFF